jgi:hypothetical protein
MSPPVPTFVRAPSDKDAFIDGTSDEVWVMVVVTGRMVPDVEI